MPIKHVPICPFCGTEMKLEPTKLHSDGALIPLVLEPHMIQTGPNSVSISTNTLGITDYLRADIWKCLKCSFIALFQGEP